MITYGLADLDRQSGTVDCNINLPMEGVSAGILYDFLKSAGENGWELCAAFRAGMPGSRRAIPGAPGLVECKDAAEIVALIFKKV
jgi:hypothetical protein